MEYEDYVTQGREALEQLHQAGQGQISTIGRLAYAEAAKLPGDLNRDNQIAKDAGMDKDEVAALRKAYKATVE